MPFKKGDKRPEGAGIQKGQKQERTLMRERLKEKGVDLIEELGDLILRAKKRKDDAAIAEHIKTALPYCYKKMPTDHNVAGEVNHKIDYAAILQKAGIKPREISE